MSGTQGTCSENECNVVSGPKYIDSTFAQNLPQNRSEFLQFYFRGRRWVVHKEAWRSLKMTMAGDG